MRTPAPLPTPTPRSAPSPTASGAPAHASAWHVVIPIKDTTVGKSRLAQVAGAARQRLNLAIADDTVRAVIGAVGSDRVLLVTSDPVLRDSWSAAGVAVLDDPGTGLNAAVAQGFSALRHHAAPLAAVLGDLPALLPQDLRAALAAAATHPASFVPDAAGTGTVLLCHAAAAVAGRPLRPHFGTESAREHARLGAVRLDLALPRLRTDVDDDGSLAVAEALGVGPATRAALAALTGLRAGVQRD